MWSPVSMPCRAARAFRRAARAKGCEGQVSMPCRAARAFRPQEQGVSVQDRMFQCPVGLHVRFDVRHLMSIQDQLVSMLCRAARAFRQPPKCPTGYRQAVSMPCRAARAFRHHVRFLRSCADSVSMPCRAARALRRRCACWGRRSGKSFQCPVGLHVRFDVTWLSKNASKKVSMPCRAARAFRPSRPKRTRSGSAFQCPVGLHVRFD